MTLNPATARNILALCEELTRLRQRIATEGDYYVCPHCGNEDSSSITNPECSAGCQVEMVRPSEAVRRLRERIAELEAQLAGGAGLIAAERQRQISEEGWTPEHDDEHGDGYLAVAAAHLCQRTSDRWGLYAKHQHDRQRQLVIAGALIAAEIDRLARTAPKEAT